MLKKRSDENRMYQVYLKLGILCCIVFLEEISTFFANYFLPRGIIL